MSQPTKLPDDLFAASDAQWQQADYHERVRLLVERYKSCAAVCEVQKAEIHGVWFEVRDLRERNAQLVIDFEQTGEVNTRLLRELADALSRLETLKLTMHPIEGAGT
jgi:hypothetical protein